MQPTRGMLPSSGEPMVHTVEQALLLSSFWQEHIIIAALEERSRLDE